VEPTQDGVAEDGEEEGDGNGNEKAGCGVEGGDDDGDGGEFDEESDVIFGGDGEGSGARRGGFFER
jgi:hypothetical protein